MMYVKRIGALIVIIGLAILAFLLFSHKSEGYRVGVPMK